MALAPLVGAAEQRPGVVHPAVGHARSSHDPEHPVEVLVLHRGRSRRAELVPDPVVVDVDVPGERGVFEAPVVAGEREVPLDQVVDRQATVLGGGELAAITDLDPQRGEFSHGVGLGASNGAEHPSALPLVVAAGGHTDLPDARRDLGDSAATAVGAPSGGGCDAAAFDAQMVGVNARRFVGARHDSGAFGDVAERELPGDSSGVVKSAVDADLAHPALGTRASPEVVIACPIDLGLEPLTPDPHDPQSIEASIAGLWHLSDT